MPDPRDLFSLQGRVAVVIYYLDDSSVSKRFAPVVSELQRQWGNSIELIPLVTDHFPMLKRSLLYTAITRGKKLVVLVGSQKALDLAVKNHDDGARFSGLLERLRDFLR